MLKKSQDEAAKIGLHMNHTKTQLITNTTDANETLPLYEREQKYTYTLAKLL